MKLSKATVKKTLSLILALALFIGCFTALGGCGAKEHGREAFSDGAESYYAALISTFSKPILSIDEEKLAADLKSANEGNQPIQDKAHGFDIDLSLTGLDSISEAAGVDLGDYIVDLGDYIFLSLSGATDSKSASADLSLTALGDKLEALFSIDEENIAFSLPQLLDRPIAFNLVDAFSKIDLDEIAADAPERVASAFDPAELSRISQTVAPKIISFTNKYFKALVNNFPDSCFSSGEQEFRTADGMETLNCTELSADGNTIAEALKATLTQFVSDTELDGVFGEYADKARSYANKLISEIDSESAEDKEDLAKIAFRHVRFFDGDNVVGDSIYFAADDLEMSIQLGVSDGKDGRLAFFTVTDETSPEGSAPFLSAECTSAGDNSTLTLAINGNNSTESFTIDGKTEKKSGETVTTSDIKMGADNITMKLLTLTTVVRDCAEGCSDFSVQLGINLPAAIVGIKLDLGINIDVKTNNNAKVELIDTAEAITPDELTSGEYGSQILFNLFDACPHIFNLIRDGIENVF